MITTSKTASRAPLSNSWQKAISVDRGYSLLREDLRDHLRFLKKTVGFKHIRFHASFHDDVAVVHRTSDGNIHYSWHQLDKAYDFLVDEGFEPIVELNPMPHALASKDDTFFWYNMNVTPPKAYEEWETFIYEFVKHFAERYGRERLRTWYFEVWNEPNLGGFWKGTQEEYFKLYEASAKALKRFDKELRVGGPAGAGAIWNIPLATWCRDKSVPLDFISYHGYPMGEYCTYKGREGSPSEPGQHFVNDFIKAKNDLEENGFGDLPIIVTEWNTLTTGPDGGPQWVGCMDVSTLYSGAATCHYATSIAPYADAFSWWVASDIFEEAGPHLEPFGGKNQYYGMLTFHGFPKPAYHAFKFLSKMRGTRYDVDAKDFPAQANMLVTDEGSTLRALLWNFHVPEIDSQTWTDTLTIYYNDVFADTENVRVLTAKVKEGRGSAYEAWEASGRPANLTKSEEDAIAALSQPEYTMRKVKKEGDAIDVPFSLERNEMLFIEVSAVHDEVFTWDAGKDIRAMNNALNVD